MKRALSLVLVMLTLVVGSCGKKDSPTAPAVNQKIIGLSGDLAFGNVNLGESAARTMQIQNTGTAPLTFTSITAAGGTGTAGFTVSPTSGTITGNSGLNVTVTFRPTERKFYGTVLTITGNQDSGNNAININGTGVDNSPLWTAAGNGDSVFDMPTKVTRVKIVADYTKNSSNWIVKIGGKLTVNELIGTGWGQTHIEGTYLTTGDVVEITNSTGVAWSFTEIRP